ncbi:hypothetical protein ACFWY6_24250 [Streptomyces sp. NPDC059037]|uniref:hypothetical protein n=1 Tax=Streptomyces sp. NPDC059037 TaxID=3346710 RepID=UPI0036AF8DAE
MAGSPGGREVDRLAIRVPPDTSGFATSLQRFLDRIEQHAKAAVHITADTRRFGAELREKLGAIRTQVCIPVAPDTRTFHTELQTALATPTSPVPALSTWRRPWQGPQQRLREQRFQGRC